MPNHMNDSLIQAKQNQSAGPDIMISAVLHLMSNYTANVEQIGPGPCVKLAAIIERHLKALSESRDVTPVLRATCEQLSEQWADLVEQKLPKPEKQNLFARLVAKTSL